MSDVINVDIVDSKGEKTGTAALPAEIFDVETNIALMHQVVTAQAWSAVVVASLTARRVPVALVRVRPVHRSSPVVAPSTARSRVTTASAPPRR